MITRRTAMMSLIGTGIGLSAGPFSIGQPAAADSMSGKAEGQWGGGPLVRIDIAQSASKDRARSVSDAIHRALVEVADVPPNGKFHVITRRADDEIVYPEEGYLGLTYTREIVIIQVTWVSGRSIELKKKLYKRIADEVHAKAGIREEDIWISLVEEKREDWSFGSGDMQFSPKQI